MSDQTAGLDPVADCYRALLGEVEADTCCKRICVMIRRMHRDGRREPHEFHLMVLASQLMQATKSFGQYVAELHAHLEDDNYAAALRAGEAMIAHEAMLSELSAGNYPAHGATLN